MLYTVKKQGGVWTVGTDDAYLRFETYNEAVETAQAAAEVFRRNSALTSGSDGIRNMQLRFTVSHRADHIGFRCGNSDAAS
jgi:hypothetical protein